MVKILNRIRGELSFGVFIYTEDRDGRILLVKHAYGDKKWSLPGGGIECGELVSNAAMREALEETGFKIRSGRQVGIFTQRQTPGVAVLFLGMLVKEEIVGKANPKEISESGFCTVEEIVARGDEIYPGQLAIINHAENYLLKRRQEPMYGWLSQPKA